ncbi:MAG: DNA-directed RNA polymerase subunit alpha, partial [candidate division NC10 bacterium]
EFYLNAKKEGPVTAKMIRENQNVEVVSKDLVLAHVEPGGKLDMEIEISKGRAYVPAEEIQAQASWPAGFLPVDALFTPVLKVHYDVENARVGQVTDYDRLILEVWTDGSLTPLDAVIRSSKLLRESLKIFIPEEEFADASAKGFDAGAEGAGVEVGGDGASLGAQQTEILDQPVDIIELSSRASNCLKVARIRTIRELVTRREEELLAVKNFGKKSLDEIKDRLKGMGLSLGMQA